MAGSCIAWHSLTVPVTPHLHHLPCVLLITDTPATPVDRSPHAEEGSAEIGSKASTVAPADPLRR